MATHYKIFFSLILFLSGPPAFRNINFEFHSSYGQTDIWIYIKLLSYLVIFLTIFTIKNKFTNSSSKNNKFINFNFIIIIFFFYLSSILSDNVLYSFAYTCFFLLGLIFFNYYFFIFINDKSLKLIYLINIINYVFLFLIILTVILAFTFPNYVGVLKGDNFIRIIGYKVSDFKFIPAITLIINILLYFLNTKNILNKELFFVIISVISLYLSQTRSILFASLIAILIIFSFFLFSKNSSNQNLKKKMILYFSFLFIIFFISKDFLFGILTRGNTTTLLDLSGRDFIWSTILSEMKNKFFGFGLGFATKDIFINMPSFYLPGTNKLFFTENIGSAHNFYLEFLISGGWICLTCILFIHIYLFKTSVDLILHNRDLESIIISTLYFVFFFVAFFDSFAFVPSSNSFAFYWILITMILVKRDKKQLKKNEY